ncbi:MAG: phage major capsid protein [Peptoniphilaceae bacterium]|nr:phage major capsid protein [Peptoniphilaceae bacterium]MDY6018639.1 phage major capsid protein [Anaerococcus sp.]
MNLEEILKRLDEIKAELTSLQEDLSKDDVDVDEIEEKSNSLIEEKRTLLEKKKNIEDRNAKRNKLLEDIAEGRKGIVINENKIDKGEEDRNMNEKLYRSAWLKTLQGKELTSAEKREYQHTTENSKVLIPTETANKIYSLIGETHPIVGDVKKLNSGGIFRMIRHIEIKAGDAKEIAEGKQNEDEQNEFVEVLISGGKISKHIKVSYELMNMAIDAFESYIVNEIGKRIEKAMADKIISTIKDTTDNTNGKGKGLASTNIIKADKGLTVAKILDALASMKEVGTTYVYANRSDIYGSIAKLENTNQTVNFITNLQEGIKGNLLGNGIKQEDALAKNEILILDPSQFLWNTISPLEILRERDAKTGDYTIAGHLLAGGAMENIYAGALIKISGTAEPTI